MKPGHGADIADIQTARRYRMSLVQLRNGRPMEVYLAQPRGFCAGVVGAIEIVELALEEYGPPVYVRPEIEGTMGQVPGPVLLVQIAHDVAELTLPAQTQVAYITQTTLSVDDSNYI